MSVQVLIWEHWMYFGLANDTTERLGVIKVILPANDLKIEITKEE